MGCLSLFFFFIIYLLFLFLAVLGLRFCARAFSSCGEWGPLFIAVLGPLTVAASLVAEHRLQTRRLSSCGSRAQLLRGMWDRSSQTRARTRVPCIGRQILNHCATREAPSFTFLIVSFEAEQFFILMKSHLSIFFFYCLCFSSCFFFFLISSSF